MRALSFSGLVFYLTVLVRSAFAAEGPPTPLRELAQNADLIVVAQVTGVEGSSDERRARGRRAATTDGSTALPVAVLKVKRMLKGAVPRGDVRVRFEATMICPRPPRYVGGETVLAFLCSDEKTGEWRTCRQGAGTKVFDDEQALRTYAERTAEIIQIGKLEDEAERRQATAAWLVRCIADPLTRWDGAYDLGRNVDPYYREQYRRELDRPEQDVNAPPIQPLRRLPPEDFFTYLDDEQRGTLVQAVANEEQRDERGARELLVTLVRSRNQPMYETLRAWLSQTTDRQSATRRVRAVFDIARSLLESRWREADETGATAPSRAERDRLLETLRRTERKFRNTGKLKSRATLLEDAFRILESQLCGGLITGPTSEPAP